MLTTPVIKVKSTRLAIPSVDLRILIENGSNGDFTTERYRPVMLTLSIDFSF